MARGFLKKVNISVNDEINLIFLKTGLHRRLHTNQYYSFVNGSIKSSYDRGKNYTQRKKNVENELKKIGTWLKSINLVAPF